MALTEAADLKAFQIRCRPVVSGYFCGLGKTAHWERTITSGFCTGGRAQYRSSGRARRSWFAVSAKRALKFRLKGFLDSTRWQMVLAPGRPILPGRVLG